jgi:hypothetical protein
MDLPEPVEEGMATLAATRRVLALPDRALALSWEPTEINRRIAEEVYAPSLSYYAQTLIHPGQAIQAPDPLYPREIDMLHWLFPRWVADPLQFGTAAGIAVVWYKRLDDVERTFLEMFLQEELDRLEELRLEQEREARKDARRRRERASAPTPQATALWRAGMQGDYYA